MISVLLRIKLNQNKNFWICDQKTSAFPEEQQVILQDGLTF